MFFTWRSSECARWDMYSVWLCADCNCSALHLQRVHPSLCVHLHSDVMSLHSGICAVYGCVLIALVYIAFTTCTSSSVHLHSDLVSLHPGICAMYGCVLIAVVYIAVTTCTSSSVHLHSDTAKSTPGNMHSVWLCADCFDGTW